MEGVMKKRISLMLVALVLMGMCAEQSSAFSLGCFAKCMFGCVPTGNFLLCSFTCIQTCLHSERAPSPGSYSSLTSSSSSRFDVEIVEKTHEQDLDYYCNLGCATHLCAPLSTPDNLAPVEVETCVGSCSDKCQKKKY